MAADIVSPFVGTWKYSEARSHIYSGNLPRSSGTTLQIQRDRNGFRWTNEGLANGKAMKLTYCFQLDGKEYPVTGSPLYDTMAIREIDPSRW